MNYSRWATKEELLEKLTKVNYDTEIKKSGIPMMYDEENLYIKDDEAHSMVIGTTGSGKTQSTVLPTLRLAIRAEESFILHDIKGEIFEMLKGDLDKNNYNTVVINLDDPNATKNSFNPLTLPYELYKNGKKDVAIDILEKVGYYFCASENSSADLFWSESAMSLFTGLALYLFEQGDEEKININGIFELSSNFEQIEEKVKTMPKTSSVYINLASIVLAPRETKGSILSVFNQNIKLYVVRESLSKLMSNTNFDLETVQKEKTAIFIVTNNKSGYRRLISLIIDLLYQAATLANDKTRRLNILIDEFENLFKIKDFINNLTIARSNNIRFNIYVKSLLELNNTYGKENAEILKMAFGNMIYLLANDMETLEEISKLCGQTKTEEGIMPLVTVEELKLLNMFEAVILIPRINPIKTKLIPDYKIKWDK